MHNLSQYKGVFLALGAYFMWGVAPIYFKALADVTPFEILSHRILWSVLLLALIISLQGIWQRVLQIVQNKKSLLLLCISAIVIGANWLLFIWAVNNDHMLDASLGYYINPFLNVFLGLLFLNERLNRVQWFALGLAFIGVSIQIMVFGQVPYVALLLALSFGLYGLIRKKLLVDSMSGLFIETLILLPVALFYLLSYAPEGFSILVDYSELTWLLPLAGVVTTLPLLCFTGATKYLNLSTLGFFQYIGPSLMFLLAVFVYDEPLTQDKVYTFAFIWSALVIFSLDGVRNLKRAKAV